MPDYAALIQSDPEYADLLALQQADLGSFLSGGSSDIARYLIDFGFVPPNMSFGDFALDPSVSGLAQQNTEAGLSLKAKMDKAHAVAQQNIQNQLGARGILSSGARGTLEGQEGLSYRQTQSEALNALFDYLGGWQKALVEMKSQQAREKAAGLEDARADVAELYPAPSPGEGGGEGGGSGGGGAVPEWMRRLLRGETLGPAGRRLREEWQQANPGVRWQDWVRQQDQAPASATPGPSPPSSGAPPTPGTPGTAPEWMRRLARGETLGPAGRRLMQEWQRANPGRNWRDWLRRNG